MGCINSNNKQLYALKRDDMFNVSVVRVQSDQSVTLARHGFLEITPHELIFIAPEQEPIAWALQHLRRYGLTGNIFSFEAGRRCPTGPGIYTFRCCNADQFYSKFQRYINFTSVVGDRINNSIHPSHIFGRLETQLHHANQYLEPTSVLLGTALEHGTTSELFNSDSNEMNLNSPDSIQSSLTAEIIHFPAAPSYSNVHPNNPNRHSGSNIYMEQPMRTNSEHNNNNTMSMPEAYNSFGAVNRKPGGKPLLKSSSLDVPPDECAPILTPTTSEAQRLYANIENMGTIISPCLTQGTCNDILDRNYANVDVLARLDVPQISQSKSFQLDLLPEKQLTSPSNGPIVNYIVLDLDQPRSPSQCSPKAGFGSGLTLSGSGGNIENLKTEVGSTTVISLASGSSTMPKGTTLSDDNAKLSHTMIESSGSYTRIDFLKTFALMKSSTNYSDFDADHDQEESRITRHSKFVRKAYSISE